MLCSGKLYYELLQERIENKRTDVAIVRLEQLYPIAEQQLQKIIKKYNPEHLVWAQEEPENMGAWSYILRSLRHLPFEVIARNESAALLVSSKRSAKRQNEIIKQVFK